MIEPDALLIVELSASLRAARDVECLDELRHGEDLLFGAWIPAQQSEEIDHSLREVAALAIARADLRGLRVVPLEWEDREAEAVAIALAQFALAFRFEEQWQVSELWHGVSPAKGAIEEHMKGC